VEQELGLLLEAGVPDLWFRPLEGWMIGYVQVDDLAARESFIRDWPGLFLEELVGDSAPRA